MFDCQWTLTKPPGPEGKLRPFEHGLPRCSSCLTFCPAWLPPPPRPKRDFFPLLWILFFQLLLRPLVIQAGIILSLV